MDEAYLHDLLAKWEGKSELDRALIMANAMPTKETLTFTVDFSTKRQRSLGADLGSAFKKMRNELAEISCLGPTLATFEHDPKGRLHLHGMVMTDASDSMLRELLLKLGGLSENKRFRVKHQVEIKPATCSLGWGLYMTKDLLRLPASESAMLIYASQEARRLGKAHLEDLRSASIRKLGIKPDFRGRARLSRRSTAIPRRSVCRRRTHIGIDHQVGLCFSLPGPLWSGLGANLGNLDSQPDGLTLTNYIE